MAIENRRQFHRIPFSSVATLRSNGRVWPVKVEDLSISGALVSTKLAPQIEMQMRVTLFLPLGESTAIEMHGIVAHTDGAHIGIKSINMDLDSINHLRQLMMLNLGNVALINREFRSLITSTGDEEQEESADHTVSKTSLWSDFSEESDSIKYPELIVEKCLPEVNGDRRQFHRVPFVTIASVHNTQLNLPVELLDLSLKGALFRVLGEAQVPCDTDLKLHIILSNDIYIEMAGKVVHQKNDVDGFECTSIDLDSARHLVRLVELNLGDPDLMERELAILSANQHWA